MSSNQDNPFEGFKLWYYTPSAVAGGILCTIFTILTITHIWRLIKTRTYFCLPFVIGGIFEAIGYASRAAASSDTQSLTPYIIQSILILIAPSLFAASIYMILSRIIRAVNAESFSFIPVKWLTAIFVTGDIFCFMMQSTGGGLIAIANTTSDVRTAENIILGGLILQILVFFLFVAVAGAFHRRFSLHQQRRQQQSLDSNGTPIPWKRFLHALYLVSLLITFRNIVRVVEFAMGNTGYLLTHEWPIYVFDAVPMTLVLGVCLMWYLPCIDVKNFTREQRIIGDRRNGQDDQDIEHAPGYEILERTK